MYYSISTTVLRVFRSSTMIYLEEIHHSNGLFKPFTVETELQARVQKDNYKKHAKYAFNTFTRVIQPARE